VDRFLLILPSLDSLLILLLLVGSSSDLALLVAFFSDFDFTDYDPSSLD